MTPIARSSRGACRAPRAAGHELRDDFVLARDRVLERQGVPVGLPFRAHMVEAAVAVAGPAGFRGIDAIEVADDRSDRSAQAVEVEAVESGLGRRMHVRVVPGAHPLDELQDVAIAPHPRGEAPEVRERRVSVCIVRQAHDIAIDAVRERADRARFDSFAR